MRRFAARLEPVGIAACAIYLVALLSLSSCAPLIAGGAVVGAGGIGLALAPALGAAAPVLTAVAGAACSGQAVANVVANIAAQDGDAAVAERAARASHLLGLGCLW